MSTLSDVSIYPATGLMCNATPAFSSTSIIIDAANEQIELLFRAPRTGTITKVGWATRTVTTGATVDVRLETVAAGVASGTLKGTNTNVSQIVADGDDNVAFLCTLTAGASVTRGDKLALVIKNPAASYGTIQIASFSNAMLNSPHIAQAGARLAGTPMLWVEYSDAPTHVPIIGTFPAKDTIAATGVSTSSTPDVMGVHFQLASPRTVRGAFINADLDGTANVRVVTSAYHQANGTGIIATAALDAEDDGLSTSRTLLYVEFVENPLLSSDTWYRFVVEPSSTTALTVYDFNVYSAEVLACVANNWHLTTAKDPTVDGDWTNYNSGTFRVPFMWLVFDGIDQAAGGGGFPILGGSIVR